MSFEIPKTRSEKILQNILGAKNEIEPIQSRIEAILFAILNDTEIGDPYTAPARCEIEKLLVAIKDGGEYDETPLTRSGRILLCKLRGEDYTGTTQSRLEKLFLRWLYELMEITDVPPFTFNSKGNNLIDYDIYGAEDGVGNNEDKTVSGNPISVSDAIEAPADSLQVTFTPTQDGTPSIDSEPETSPYLAKVIPRGNKEYCSLVGGTVAWNQMSGSTGTSTTTRGLTYSKADGTITITGTTSDTINNGVAVRIDNNDVTIPSGHVIYYSANSSDPRVSVRLQGMYITTPTYRFYKTTNTNVRYDIVVQWVIDEAIPTGTQINIQLKPQIFDLTLMFGSTIADYIASLEQATAGSGIAWLKSYGFFTKDYYAYNPGELISVNTSGHKIGSTTYPIDNIDLRGLFKLSNDKLYCEGDIYPPSGGIERKYGIVDLGSLSWVRNTTNQFYSPVLTEVAISGTTNAITSSWLKVSSNAAYGKTEDKTLTIGTRVWVYDTSYNESTDLKNAMSGVYLVYELATPTTESATAYTSPIDVEAGGTEEFIDNRTVPIPVGNETYYASEFAVHGKTGVAVSHGATEDDPNPTEYEVEFTQQGTVYGGTVDIVSGVLTVVNKDFTYNSIEYYGTYGSDNAPLYYADIPNYATEPVKRHPSVFSDGLLLSNIFAPISTEYLLNMKNYEIRISDAALPSRFYMRVDGQNPVSASNPLEIVAELQTPQTYQLTTQQVQMLLNDNYLTTPDGTITLTYKDHNIEVPFSVSCGGGSNSYRVDLSDKLYKVGAYADSISYDDQTVKREIEVLRLTGTEEWVLNDGIFSTMLSVVARTPAVLCNELTTDQCYISDDLTTINITNVSQTSVEEFTSWLRANDIYVQYVREHILVTSHAVPEVSTFNGTNTFSVDTDVTPSEVTIIYPNRVTTRALPKTKKIGKSKLTKSK